jgi:hypothetical protein
MVHQGCNTCAAFERQLKDFESLISRLLDDREQTGHSLTQDEDSRHRLDALIKLVVEARDLQERHKHAVHSNVKISAKRHSA